MIDITTTATIRPDIFRTTLSTFCNKLFTDKSQYRLIINVDPIGDDKDPIEIIDIAKEFFTNILVNIPQKPNFAQAVKWCWERTTSEFVFHLEDDWKLRKNIDINHLISIMNQYKNMIGLRLSKSRVKNFSAKEKNDSFIESRKVVLNPIFLRGEFVRDIAQKMDIINNPERQIRTTFGLTEDKIVGIYCGVGEGRYVRHIGSDWQKVSKWDKIKGSNFITWDLRENING